MSLTSSVGPLISLVLELLAMTLLAPQATAAVVVPQAKKCMKLELKL